MDIEAAHVHHNAKWSNEMRAQTKALAAALAAALAFTGLQPAAAADASALVGLEEAEYAIDSDNDGLPDDWETEGVVFPDGTELALPEWGVDPHRPDLFLQLNWMEDHNGRSFAPSAQALQDIVKLFDEHGIALHIDAGETYTNIPNYTEFHGGETVGYSQYYFADQITGVRLLQDIDTHLGDRSNVFRLGIIGDQIDRGDYTTGVALVGDSAFFVANNDQIDTDEQLRNAILHEFGHTLGLRHNGSADVTRKLPRSQATPAEYLSVMNYDHEFTHFNYSEEAYIAEGPNGPVEVPADWDSLVLDTPRIGHDALELGARTVSHGAAPAVAASQAQASQAATATPAKDSPAEAAPAKAADVNVAAIVGSVVAALAVLGIAGAGFAAMNGLLPF